MHASHSCLTAYSLPSVLLDLAPYPAYLDQHFCQPAERVNFRKLSISLFPRLNSLHPTPHSPLSADPPYLEKYIAQPAPGCQRSFMALEDECFKQEGWRPFKSLQPLVRYFTSGLAIAFWLPPDGVEAAGNAAREAADMWLAFMRGGAGAEGVQAGSEGPKGGQGGQGVPEGERGALGVRDAALRRAGVWGDAHFTMLGKVFGEEALGVMGELLTGEPRPQQ